VGKYRVILAPELDGMLLSHVRFIANVSVPAAKRFRTEYAEIIKRIADNPYQFPEYENPALPKGIYRKALFAKWYKAVFYVEGDTVYLDAVVDGRSENG